MKKQYYFDHKNPEKNKQGAIIRDLRVPKLPERSHGLKVKLY